MQKSWLITLAFVAACAAVSGNAIAQNISEEEMQNIKQYCDEMNAYGSFASETERLQAVDGCVKDEVSRTSEYSTPDESGEVQNPQ